MEVHGVLEVLEQSSLAGSELEYLSVFSKMMDQAIGLSGSVCFKLNPLKDRLIVMSSTLISVVDKTPEFSLKDTQNPIVFALIADKPYVVHAPNTLRNIDLGLLQLIKAVPAEDAMFCYPFKYGVNKQDHGVFVFFANKLVIDELQGNEIHQRLLNVMAGMLGIYSLAERKDLEKQTIRDDLVNQSRDSIQKTVREQIAQQYIGLSPQMRRVCDLVARAAASEVAVLLRGETGVGKDLAASLIHQFSKRSDNRFMVVNCAAIPEHLLESELFGYVKGAFTGAIQDKDGLILQANKGTLFLDEIGDLSAPLQAKLLRVLQEKRFTPVGASEEIESDFRLITATHRPLEQWVEKDKFRQDIFYRINQFSITIPALQERKIDIPVLVDFFTNIYIQENTTHISGYEEAAMLLLTDYSFPGNIRELKNLVFQACMFVDADNLVTKENIQARLDSLIQIHPAKKTNDEQTISLDSDKSLPEATDHYEKKLIRIALKKAGGSRSKAAETLGIPKRTLAHKCKKWSICNGG